MLFYGIGADMLTDEEDDSDGLELSDEDDEEDDSPTLPGCTQTAHQPLSLSFSDDSSLVQRPLKYLVSSDHVKVLVAILRWQGLGQAVTVRR